MNRFQAFTRPVFADENGETPVIDKKTVSQEHLHRMLRYDAKTGDLFWKKRGSETFKSERSMRIWNTRYAGKKTAHVNAHGYVTVCLHNVHFLAHRIIWRMVTGDWPEQIDHINGNRSDNRWANLRSVSLAENNRNMKIPACNSSGVVGVRRINRPKPWEARIWKDGKPLCLGTYATFEEAVIARRKAERKLGFHPNHGQRA